MTPKPTLRHPAGTLALLVALAACATPVATLAATGSATAPTTTASAVKTAKPALHPLTGTASAAKKAAPAAPVKLVDINSASKAELKTLPGIGDAEADRIVAARPFLTKAELVTKKVIPTGPYLSLKNRVIAMQKGKPKAAAKPKP
jgi:DNA uptake protein ComE-like DNA-binding protein